MYTVTTPPTQNKSHSEALFDDASASIKHLESEVIKVNSSNFQYSFDNKTENFDDLPARFGYRLPSDGLKVSAEGSEMFVWQTSDLISS